MSSILSSKVLIVASVCYGITIAILGAASSAAVGLVATIGALVIGGLWAVRGLFIHRSRG